MCTVCTVGVQLVYSWCTVGVQLVYKVSCQKNTTFFLELNMDLETLHKRLLEWEFQTLITHRTLIFKAVTDHGMKLRFINNAHIKMNVNEDICSVENAPSVIVVLYSRTEHKFVAVLLLSSPVRLVGGFLLDITVENSTDDISVVAQHIQ
jgi:transcription antitermination factor NusA-like protein